LTVFFFFSSSFRFLEHKENVTEAYRDLITAIEGGSRELPANAEDFEYLFVPGLLTEHYGAAYMQTNLERMQGGRNSV
jgi:hypothetical protein